MNCSSLGDCTGGAYMVRPANFTGFTSVVSGAPTTALTATEWNAFIDRLIAFALYKAKGNEIGSFSIAYSGARIRDYYNEAVRGLRVLSEFISQPIPSEHSGSDKFYASYIQQLKNALNSIQ